MEVLCVLGRSVFVARNGRGTILGWCAAHTESDFWGDRYFDVDVYVKSDYRRRGVATKLLKHAIKRLRPLHRKLLIPGELSKAVKFKGRDFD